MLLARQSLTILLAFSLSLLATDCSTGLEPSPAPTRVDAYGDPLPRGAVARLGTLRFRHNDYAPRCIAASPTDDYIASGTAGTDRTLRLWNAKDGKMIWRVELSPVAVTFFPDGKHLVCAAEGENSCIIEVSSGRKTPLGLVGGATSVAVSRNGTRFAICSLSEIYVWKFERGELSDLVKIETSLGEAIAFSADGSLIVAGDRGRFAIWEVGTQKKQAEWKTVEERVRLVAFHSADREVVSVIDGNRNSTVDIWDAKTGHHRGCRYSWFFPIASADLSKDGSRLSLLTNRRGNEIVVLDLEDEKYKRIVHVPARAQRVAWSGDGKTIATLSAGICIWDWQKDAMVHGYPEILPDVHSDRFEWNDRYFVTDQQVWDVRKGKVILSVDAPDTVGVMRDGALFVVSKKNVTTPDGHPLLADGQRFADERQPLFSSKSRRVFITAVSNTTALPRGRSELRLIDFNGERPKVVTNGLSMHDGGAAVRAEHRFLLTPNESGLAFLASANSLGLVDLASGIVSYHAVNRDAFAGCPLQYLSVDAGGQCMLALGAGRDPRSVLWIVKQPDSPHVLYNLAIDGRPPIAGLPFVDRTREAVVFLYQVERDGEDFSMIRTFGSDAQVRRTWEIRNNDTLAQFILSQHGELLARTERQEFFEAGKSWPDHTSPDALFAYGRRLPAAAVSHTGHLAITSDLDGVLTVWERPSQSTLTTLRGDSRNIVALLFSPSDELVVSFYWNGTAVVWNLQELDDTSDVELISTQELCMQLVKPSPRSAWRAVAALVRRGDAAVKPIADMHWPTRISPAEARNLIAQLDSDQFDKRQRAFRQLRDHIANVRSVVDTIDLEGLSTEVKVRIQELKSLDELACSPPDVIGALRGLEGLERIGTPAALSAASRLLEQRDDLDERVRHRLIAIIARKKPR